jgi:hypothetical protein
MKTKTLLMLMAATLTAGVAIAQDATPAPKVTGEDELVQTTGRYAATWVRPDVDLSHYTKLLLWKTAFQFRDVGKTPTSVPTSVSLGNMEGPFSIDGEDRQKFEEIVDEALVKQLARSKEFEVVDQPGPNTLIVRPMMLDIISSVPPSPIGYTNVYLASVGEATIVFELVDAETGTIVARAGERRSIKPQNRMVGVNPAPMTSATVFNDVRRWSYEVARELRVALDKARKKAEKK